MKFVNTDRIPVVDSFLRLYGESLETLFPRRAVTIEFRNLPDSENEYHDVIVRLLNSVYVSAKETGNLGLTEPEIFAALMHEIGHILYGTLPFGSDAEMRADTLAAEMGLGLQMISVLEKIISSRRFRNITGELVRRIQYLQHIA